MQPCSRSVNSCPHKLLGTETVTWNICALLYTGGSSAITLLSALTLPAYQLQWMYYSVTEEGGLSAWPKANYTPNCWLQDEDRYKHLPTSVEFHINSWPKKISHSKIVHLQFPCDCRLGGSHQLFEWLALPQAGTKPVIWIIELMPT